MFSLMRVSKTRSVVLLTRELGGTHVQTGVDERLATIHVPAATHPQGVTVRRAAAITKPLRSSDAENILIRLELGIWKHKDFEDSDIPEDMLATE